MQNVREQNKKLAEDLGRTQTQLKAVEAELDEVKKWTREAHGKWQTHICLIENSMEHPF
jgi:hypothetical protein